MGRHQRRHLALPVRRKRQMVVQEVEAEAEAELQASRSVVEAMEGAVGTVRRPRWAGVALQLRTGTLRRVSLSLSLPIRHAPRSNHSSSGGYPSGV